jgi:hypothetical protein
LVEGRAGRILATPALWEYPGDAVRALVFFGLFYGYFWLRVQPCLIYSCAEITNFPVFYTGWAFFQESVLRPGGVVQYLSAFVSQFLLYSWTGALVIAMQAWAISACTGYLFRAAGLPGARLLRFTPAILVLVAYAQYSYHLPLFMAALAALVFACLYVRLATRDKPDGSGAAVNLDAKRDAMAFVLLSVLLYVIGAAASIPFAVFCVAYELRQGRWRWIGPYLAFAAVLPYVMGGLVFRISIVDAYTDMLPVSWRVHGWPTREDMVATVYGVYLVPLVGILAGGAWHLILSRFQRRQSPAKPSKPAVKDRHAGRDVARSAGSRRPIAVRMLLWTLGSLVLFAAGGAAAILSLDARQKALLEVHHYACRRMWPQVLAAARRCPDSPFVIDAVNRALYHSGRLSRDMFRYLQQPQGLLILGDDRTVVHWHAFDTLIDLGLMNLAEKNLTECLEIFGPHPLILERLALVNLVKGKTDAARVYLGAMAKTLFHGRRAREQLARLDADPHVQELRVLRLQRDSVTQFYARESLLSALVEQSGGTGPHVHGPPSAPPNRMAFEYLMAWYLLNGHLGKFVQQLSRLDEFGYAEIPPLYQEAVVIYAYGRTIGPEMHSRMRHLHSVVTRHGNNREAAARELVRDYYGSYFFYYFCTFVAARK